MRKYAQVNARLHQPSTDEQPDPAVQGISRLPLYWYRTVGSLRVCSYIERRWRRAVVGGNNEDEKWVENEL